MGNMITSEQTVSASQIDGFANVVADATRKSTREELNALAEAGHLNSASMQRVIAGGGRITGAVAKAVRTELREIASGVFGCLKLISAGNRVVIPSTDGTETLATANDVFNHIDSDFKNWGCDGVERPTPETPVEVYELVKDANYRTIYGHFGQNLDRLCLTTPQIKKFFAAEADNWLREDGWAVYQFLFKVGNEFFVARAYRYEDGHRKVDVRRFSDDCVWYAESRRRFVLPQL